jgi:hypothetical protein
MRGVAMAILAGVVSFALACADRALSPIAPGSGGTGDPAGRGGGPAATAGAGGANADAGQPGPPPDGLFVTMQDATGTETVFRTGIRTTVGCGERLDTLIEPGCPGLSMFFQVHNPEYPLHVLELYVQGGYGFVRRSDGALHHRTVSEIAIDAQDAEIVTGHYRLSLDEAPGPATDIWGRFALCSETGRTIEPCRNM